jgi:hypothetical protein
VFKVASTGAATARARATAGTLSFTIRYWALFGSAGPELADLGLLLPSGGQGDGDFRAHKAC